MAKIGFLSFYFLCGIFPFRFVLEVAIKCVFSLQQKHDVPSAVQRDIEVIFFMILFSF